MLITGASSGFGEEFARQYAEQGHSLILVARRLDRLQALAETLRWQHRIEVVVEQVDLSNIEAIVQLHRRLSERGIAIGILINNAGHGLQGPFVDSQLGAALAMVQLDVASLTAVPTSLHKTCGCEDAGRSCWWPACSPIRAWRTSPSMQPPRPTYCIWVKRFIAN